VLFLQKVATLFAGANLGVKIFYLVLLSILWPFHVHSDAIET
jgi:hypothetical protein